MSVKMFFTYRLKPGADLDEYKRWSVEVDQPFCREQSVVHSFDVYVVEAPTGPNATATIVEEMWVDSYEAFVEAAKSPEWKALGQTWRERFADTENSMLVYGTKIG
jgi:hypothetical protein